jgi:hypothetical protein
VTGKDEQYKQHRTKMAAASKQRSAQGRDIGSPPAVVNPARRESCRMSFKLFCETYFADTFCIAWSEDHLKVIEIMERVVLEGGKFALAMPRGTGKTSLVIAAVLWAILFGHRRFVAVIAATGDDSEKMVETIKAVIETEETIAEDFPEVAHPIRALEGINQRAAGQTCEGRQTRIKWTGQQLVFPDVEGSKCGGSVVRCSGITGAIRGMQRRAPDGSTIRPDLALCDDPQTDDSAHSLSECNRRERVIKGAVGRLAGPRQTIAVMIPCTVIVPDDLAARLLDRNKNPEYQGKRLQLLHTLPTDLALWKQYKDVRGESLREHGDIRTATEFYRQNQAKMDAGAEVAWPERYEPHQLSAVQYAMDIWAEDEEVFAAEFQNDPIVRELAGVESLKADEVAARLSGVPRQIVPDWCDVLTAFIDVQMDSLWWMVVGWSKAMRGQVIHYGVWPEQGREYVLLSDTRVTLRDLYRASSVEHGILAGLTDLQDRLLGRQWERQTEIGGVVSIDLLVVDANWQLSTDLVYQVARTHANGKILPWHGRYIGASSLSMDGWKKERGEREGPGWRVQLGRRKQKHIVADVNQWKSFCAKRLSGPVDPLGIGLPGDRSTEHRMLGDHFAAEYGVETEGRGRRVTEWKLRPGRDNHLWDGLVGSAVAASICGAEMPGQRERRKARKVRASELQQAKRAARGVRSGR